MHEIDLENFNVRTDMIIEEDPSFTWDDQKIKVIESKKGNSKYFMTICFKDITDKDNYHEVLKRVVLSLNKMLKRVKIKNEDSCLVIGLGNPSSTPDSLGPKTIEKVLVTRHLFALGDVSKGYRNVASFIPSVTGVTGIETSDTIISLVKKIKPDFLIVIDALASSKIKHLTKIIQIANTGISPGSGIGNRRSKITKETLKIPVIVLGIPTVVDEVTIVYDVIKSLGIKVSKDKINEVIMPIDYNLVVTPKDIDFKIEKLSTLLSSAINEVLHTNYNSTK